MMSGIKKHFSKKVLSFGHGSSGENMIGWRLVDPRGKEFFTKLANITRPFSSLPSPSLSGYPSANLPQALPFVPK